MGRPRQTPRPTTTTTRRTTRPSRPRPTTRRPTPSQTSGQLPIEAVEVAACPYDCAQAFRNRETLAKCKQYKEEVDDCYYEKCSEECRSSASRGKQILTVGSTSATRSVTLPRPLARLSAKKMRRSVFGRPNARSLKATLTAVPQPVLPSVQTRGGVSAAREVFLSVEVLLAVVLSDTTSSMGSDYMLTKMVYWNQTTKSQHPVIRSSRGFLSYK